MTTALTLTFANPFTTDDGVIRTRLSESEADGAENLDTQQRNVVIGEPVPIIFCRRINNVGGVLISPPATEARFEDSVLGDITASYHLVLGEGQIDSIQIRDVFQRACRVGTFTQTFGKRAGTFVPGNFINNSPDLQAPYYCGTGGTYAGLSTMAFTVTIPAGFDQWNRQVHCFVRGGLHLTRLIDNNLGPSNNIADLLLYLLRSCSRVAEEQIDLSSFTAAANFTEINGFWFNGVLSSSTNLREWIANTLQYFLLRQTRVNGKETLRPMLPTNINGTLKTTPLNFVYVFSEEHIVPSGFEITYSTLESLRPFCVQVLWRQQDDLGIPIMRTAEVRYAGTAEDGPYEQHDLSSFCCSENHAVKVGAYILSKRRHVTHRVQLTVRPDTFNSTLVVGDLVRVRLERVTSTGAASMHDYLYEVDKIYKSLTGEVKLELTHFPVNENLCSVVAAEVDAAVGSGIVLPTGLTGVSCDVNSSGNTGIPSDTSIGGWSATGTDANGNPYTVDWDNGGDEFQASVTGVTASGRSWWGYFTQNRKASTSTPSITGATGAGGKAQVGDELGFTLGCEGGWTEWRLVDDATGQYTIVSSGVASTYIVASEAAAIGKSIVGVGKCPDPSSPTGYGPEVQSTPIIARAFVPGFENVTFTGSYSPTGLTTITRTGVYKGYLANPPTCTLRQSSANGSSNHSNGITDMRIEKLTLTSCNGYFSFALQVLNKNGVWENTGAINGGGGWYAFEGSLSFSSTAPDAVSAENLKYE